MQDPFVDKIEDLLKRAQGQRLVLLPGPPEKGYAEVAVDPNPMFKIAPGQDLYSKDRNWSFELGFLWGQHVPWAGRKPFDQHYVSDLVADRKLLFEGAPA